MLEKIEKGYSKGTKLAFLQSTQQVYVEPYHHCRRLQRFRTTWRWRDSNVRQARGAEGRRRHPELPPSKKTEKTQVWESGKNPPLYILGIVKMWVSSTTSPPSNLPALLRNREKRESYYSADSFFFFGCYFVLRLQTVFTVKE